MVTTTHGTEETSRPNAVRGTEAASELSSDQTSDRGLGSIGSNDGNDPIGISRETWERRINFLLECFSGGILDRLIQQAEDQFNNANACLEWYEREKDRAEAALQHLRDLRQQLSPPDESTELTKDAE